MATLIYQSSATVGWNVGGFNAGGFGGFIAASNVTQNDAPLICYDNQFAKPNNLIANPLAAMNVSVGTVLAGNIADNNTTNPLVVQTSGTGCQIELTLQAASTVNCLILAGSRYETAGYRSPFTKFQLTLFRADNSSILVEGTAQTNSGSEVVQFPDIVAVKAILVFNGLPAIANIPDVFLGKGLKMPYLELGFDPYNEVSTGQTFTAESGREYPQLRYRKMELSPSWAYVEKARWAEIDLFRGLALELKLPFYFAWMPATLPTEIYLVRNNSQSAPMPYVSAMHRSFNLMLVEVI